ncbi:hypothetical protein B0H13DRAFT_1859627 [Mycena leptocephala]|nr:hypothetical protein B0H13DRAFT_1859627 [Mycena leptocephala]
MALAKRVYRNGKGWRLDRSVLVEATPAGSRTCTTRSLPVFVELMVSDLTEDGIAEIRKRLIAAYEKWLAEATTAMAGRIPLIQGRLERDEEGNFVATTLKLRQYLRVPVPAHRRALTRLLLWSHILSIEILASLPFLPSGSGKSCVTRMHSAGTRGDSLKEVPNGYTFKAMSVKTGPAGKRAAAEPEVENVMKTDVDARMEMQPIMLSPYGTTIAVRGVQFEVKRGDEMLLQFTTQE